MTRLPAFPAIPISVNRQPVGPRGLALSGLGLPPPTGTACDQAIRRVYPSWGPDSIFNLAVQTCEEVAKGVKAADKVLLDARDAVVQQLQARIADVEPLLNSWLGSQFGGQFTRGPKALLELIKWFAAVGAAIAPLGDPNASDAQRRQAMSQLDPLLNNSAVYNLFFDPQYERAADAVAVSIFAISAVGALPIIVAAGPQQLLIIAANLASQPTPYLKVVRDTLTVARDIKNGNGVPGQALISLGQDYLQILWGVRVGPATAILVAVKILMGMPVPPTAEILALIAKDPQFRKDLKNKGLNPYLVDKGLPALATCVTASDADQFLRCAQGVIEVVLPGIVRGMRQYGVSLSDARVVITQLWRTGGDIALAFDQDDEDGRAATAALLALGVGGLVAIAEVAGASDFIGYFESRIGPIVPRDVGNNLRKGIKFYALLAKVFGQYRPDQTAYAVKNPGDSLGRALQALNDARWNFELAMPALSLIVQDFVSRNGQPLVTPELKQLLLEIKNDHTLSKIARIFCDLFNAAGIPLANCRPVTSQAVQVQKATTPGGSTQQSLQPGSGGSFTLTTPTVQSTPPWLLPLLGLAAVGVGVAVASSVSSKSRGLAGTQAIPTPPNTRRRRRRRSR